MAIKSQDLRLLKIRPFLQMMDWWMPNSENLLIGTAAVESQMGEFLKQIKGPALGIFQMEPDTYNWLRDDYLEARPDIKSKIMSVLDYAYFPDASLLMYDIGLAIIMCRLKYRTVKEAIPNDENDIFALAKYWKKYYNTPLGAGTPEKFVEAYKKYC